MKKSNKGNQCFETPETFVRFSVGEKIPYDLSSFPSDFNVMEMIEHPFFISSISNIQTEELAHFEHGEPIEFRVYSGTGAYQNYSLLLCKFNNWVQEFAFNPNLCRDEILNYMNMGSNIFSVIVIEGTTRRIKILRTLGFSDETRNELYKLWENMLSENISQETFLKWYRGLFTISTEQLWESAKPIGKWISLY